MLAAANLAVAWLSLSTMVQTTYQKINTIKTLKNYLKKKKHVAVERKAR